MLVFAQGKTFGETIENLVDALQLWVEDCMEHGKLREALKEGGHEDLYDEFMEDTTHSYIPPICIERIQCHV